MLKEEFGEKMKAIMNILLLCILVVPRITYAETNPQEDSFFDDVMDSYISQDGYFDLKRLCIDKNSSERSNECHIDYKQVKIIARCIGGDLNYLNVETSIQCKGKKLEIISSLFIHEFSGRVKLSKSDVENNIFVGATSETSLTRYKLESLSRKISILDSSKYYPHVANIKFRGGTEDSIPVIFQGPVREYISLLDYTYLSTSQFQSEIAASHQSHLDRYLVSLEDCLAILKDERNYTILDWRVQECSRRVVVFGVVLNELLEDYSHVTRLQTHIAAIMTLTNSIRASYGWDRGLAGSASKATGALLEVIKFEIREILSIKISVGASNYDSYTVMIKEITKLLSKVNVSRAGDMAVQRNIWDFVDVWNTDDWQIELSSLISAPIDEKKLILPKLQLLLMAVESLNDLTNAGLEIPELEE